MGGGVAGWGFGRSRGGLGLFGCGRVGRGGT